ncbi:Glycoside hydrolase [Parasponia andersonii]|uniref:Glycoside hydrolase n=1 Tax=Parasponia andersonii TaxID=3476 RepID=A0A2P5A6I1_PARAD|nr:Glycoside hydrolase [Parasponia andersonii]
MSSTRQIEVHNDMENHCKIVLFFLLSLTFKLTCSEGDLRDQLTRKQFPEDFIFGTASAAYQYEGAANESGRKPSIWDTFTNDYPEKIADHSSGAVAQDFYHRYEEDIEYMSDIGFDTFRFSISWSRILPYGTPDIINSEGVEFYHKLINYLKAKGLKPVVTLFHWDLPQALENKYGGLLSQNFVKDFRKYAGFCFQEFGNSVEQWITFNEPYVFATHGYQTGIKAPGRCSHYAGNCTKGNSAVEPYKVIHHLLLAHAEAVHLYWNKYQLKQKGIIGLTEASHWMVPKFYTPESSTAAYRALDFMLGWTVHPITYGDYPETMRNLVGCRLPKFTKAQSALLKGSFDFLGLNYYTARYAEEYNATCFNPTPENDSRVLLTTEKNGVPIGDKTALDWLYVYPKGIEDLVLYVKENYNNPNIYITENGFVDPKINDTIDCSNSALKDDGRIKFHRDHLWHLLNAIKAGANVKGYFIWSFEDNFEWQDGYTAKFGIYCIDYKNQLARKPKKSVSWFQKFLYDGCRKIPREGDADQLNPSFLLPSA